ncbi:MFS transporter [Kribbella koreensis]|uniref:MFS transporter n=1 Tax=Kribbella koreensis TaxID=57909 RepID=A0ABN1RES3_9ACTN
MVAVWPLVRGEFLPQTRLVTEILEKKAVRRRLHRAWPVAAVGFITLIGAAGFRSVPSVLLDPLHEEFGWSHATISAAVSINLLLYGLISPFAAALMDRLGLRKVVSGALVLIALGSGLTIFMNSSWQLLLCWGLLVGVGTGSMSMTFVATITGRWFVERRGLVTGILTAAGATGQLVFLPLIAHLAGAYGWRVPALVAAGAALAVVPLVLLFLRDYPSDVGLRAYGAPEGSAAGQRVETTGNSGVRALTALWKAMHRPAFWLLAGGFAICGASTNGLVGTHFVTAAHDHGMPATTAASLLALVGIFDVGGTIVSGWLTDRWDPRYLLIAYYSLRGLSLLVLPSLLGPTAQPSVWVFIIFYGLDWVATVPPTVALCREWFGADGPIVFGWVFASHQIGAAIAATGAGAIRDAQGSYNLAWYLAGGLCAAAALMSASIGRRIAVA